jgi:TPP-dependent pyruvate/acetoin dehydrogenase alpha subunit
VARFQAHGLEAGWFDEHAADAIARQAGDEVERAVSVARASPVPEPELAAQLVYAQASPAP